MKNQFSGLKKWNIFSNCSAHNKNPDFEFSDLEIRYFHKTGEDQVSWIHRQGMDRMRIYAIKKIIDSKILSEKQYLLAVNELGKKCTVFGRGCLKHGKNEIGKYYLELAEAYKTL